MTIHAEQIQNRLTEQLRPDYLEVIDESAQHAGHAGANAELRGTHFRIRISSPSFNSQTRLMRHRLVYDALKDFLEQGIHALAIEVVNLPVSTN
jgi:BolA protein